MVIYAQQSKKINWYIINYSHIIRHPSVFHIIQNSKFENMYQLTRRCNDSNRPDKVPAPHIYKIHICTNAYQLSYSFDLLKLFSCEMTGF